MFCPNCGAENTEGSKFCKKCGQVLPELPAGAEMTEQQPVAAAPPGMTEPASSPTAPIPPGSPPSMAVGPGPGMVTPMPPKKKKSKALPLILGLVALLVVAAVALVLIFVVFKGDSAASGPEKTVEQFLKAVENNDSNGIINVMDPAFLRELRRTYGSDYETMLTDAIFAGLPGENVKFSGVKYQTKITGDTATVTITEGTLEYEDSFGDRQKEPVDKADLPQLDLLKKGDTWYLDFSSLI